MKTAERKLLGDLKRLITSLIPEAEIWLYGSRARGNPDAFSDFDLIVVTEKPISAQADEKLQDAIYDFELDRQVVLSVMFFDRAQWNAPLTLAMPFRQRVQEEAVAL